MPRLWVSLSAIRAGPPHFISCSLTCHHAAWVVGGPTAVVLCDTEKGLTRAQNGTDPSEPPLMVLFLTPSIRDNGKEGHMLDLSVDSLYRKMEYLSYTHPNC